MISLSTFSARIDNTIAALRVAESYPVSEREQLLQLLASEFHGGHLSSRGRGIQQGGEMGDFSPIADGVDRIVVDACTAVKEAKADDLVLTVAETLVEIVAWHTDAHSWLHDTFPFGAHAEPAAPRAVFSTVALALDTAIRLVYRTHNMNLEVASDGAARVRQLLDRLEGLLDRNRWFRELPGSKAIETMRQVEQMLGEGSPADNSNFARAAELLRTGQDTGGT